MKTIICKFGELDLRELAKFTSVAQTGTTDKTDMFAGWFEEDLLPLEHVVILGKEAEQLLGWVLLVDQGYNIFGSQSLAPGRESGCLPGG